jgi:hypothetical protein
MAAAGVQQSSGARQFNASTLHTYFKRFKEIKGLLLLYSYRFEIVM